MVLSVNLIYLQFAWLIGVCYGFVLLSSADGQVDLDIFKSGEAFKYKLHSTVLLNEINNGSKNVGFYIDGSVLVETVWSSGPERLVKITLKNPRLHVKSRKAPSPDGFVHHDSKLDTASNNPFLVIWKKGKIDKILLPQGESPSLLNLKKGLGSLFQFQTQEGTKEETDSSGICTVFYSTEGETIRKTKTNCKSRDFHSLTNPDPILKTVTESFRTTEYSLEGSDLKEVSSKEKHLVYLGIKEELGNLVEAHQLLKLETKENCDVINSVKLEEAVALVAQRNGIAFTQETLLTDLENFEESQSLSKILSGNWRSLVGDNLGSLKSARVFLKLIQAARSATRKELVKALDFAKDKQVFPQILDVFGYVQSLDSHEAVMKKLHLDLEDSIDDSERYLWALSLCSQPSADVIKDLLKRHSHNDNLPEVIKDTLILTIASMTYRLSQTEPEDPTTLKIYSQVEEEIVNGLDYAKNEQKHVYYRAMKNLKSGKLIPVLLKSALGSGKESVLAWKALRAYKPNNEILNAAKKVFFQLDKIYDSSSRTLAVEILLQSNPNQELLKELVFFLKSRDNAFEVKQYLWQSLLMKSEEEPEFGKKLWELIKQDPSLHNWNSLAPRGLSTALKRNFLNNTNSKGALVSTQEIKSSIAKRGNVNVMLERNGTLGEIFSLGIFSGGLTSFMSNDEGEDNAEQEEEESVTAGMELTVLGTQLRPFVFFNGQGELMQKVWAGAASERTTAYQALLLLQDHDENLRLGSGFIARLDVKGAVSFDLSGKIQISLLWSRSAESLVEKSAGVLVLGSLKIDSSFVISQVEFAGSLEPRLTLQTDIDMSSKLAMCMRLSQPETLFKHNVIMLEKIPGSKHKLRIEKNRKRLIPGVTYNLNRKNNRMCSEMFSIDNS